MPERKYRMSTRRRLPRRTVGKDRGSRACCGSAAEHEHLQRTKLDRDEAQDACLLELESCQSVLHGQALHEVVRSVDGRHDWLLAAVAAGYAPSAAGVMAAVNSLRVVAVSDMRASNNSG